MIFEDDLIHPSPICCINFEQARQHLIFPYNTICKCLLSQENITLGSYEIKHNVCFRAIAYKLYNDLATWCSDLKKIAISITPLAYALSPPADILVQECAAWVEAATAELLDSGRFLHCGLDKLGKPGILHTLHFLRVSRPAIFQKEVPLKCLALVCTAFHCVFQGLKKDGNGKCYSKFTSKEYESIFHSMLRLLNDVMKDPYHSPKLVQQLHEWAKVGWVEATKPDGIDTSKHHHPRVQPD
ncbi:uncharacterized protein EDB91DRAFT_1086726 [Suillus paluster]|uniref:uncharacterized protein n=1 Tax=Suillus paluster TaxID=48578 RepID=UPI001B86172A|nr:uncharacterized protein EDB91DRAFT_1086726 [Suillus paluster]KAG1726643.1 hypothetical protein EDB91DRAFT_1086726 [Suillus paluster]